MTTDTVNGGNSGKGGRIVIIVAAIIIIALLAVIIALVLNRGGDDEANAANSASGRETVVVSEDNVEDVLEEMANAEYVEPGYYTASMSNVWTFATGDAISEDAYVENVAGNTNDVYFDVFLEEDEENPIYASPIIPRGAELDGIRLDTPLSAGTYNCVLIYHLIDDNESQNTVSTLRVGITIIVEG